MHQGSTNHLKPIPKTGARIIGLVLCSLSLLNAYAIYSSSSQSGLYVVLMVVVGAPLGLMGLRLLFASNKQREYGLFSPITLVVVGILTSCTGVYLSLEGARGASIFVGGGLVLIGLAKVRAKTRKNNRNLFRK
jgi:hypothetical protein